MGWVTKPELITSLPRPRNDAELEIASEYIFGVPLHATFDLWGSGGRYHITEPYSSYHGKGFHYLSYSCEGYDRSAYFWKHVFGELSCGGIAGHSYGSFEVNGWRNRKRLENWKSLKGKTVSAVRPFYERLAAQNREQKNREIRGVSVHSIGRVDGAIGVSNAA